MKKNKLLSDEKGTAIVITLITGTTGFVQFAYSLINIASLIYRWFLGGMI